VCGNVTPHIGGSTEEAQEKAGISVAASVRLALSGELVPDAVNVQGGVIAEEVRPAIPLTEKLGRIFTALAGEVAQQIDVEVRGEITEYDVKVLELAALKGVFTDVVEEQVSYVNAPLLAAERGTAVRLVAESESPDHRNLITIRGTLADIRDKTKRARITRTALILVGRALAGEGLGGRLVLLRLQGRGCPRPRAAGRAL